MTTTETITTALKVLKNQDWYWMMADYTHPAIDNARDSMRYFVKLVATIKDGIVRNAMRELWKITYENVHANMWSKNEEANKAYEVKKAELMSTILPVNLQMAA